MNGIINNRPAKHRQEAIPPEKMKHGDVSAKVAVMINNQTIIFVEPDKIESAKQDWLTRYQLGQDRLYRNKMTQDVRPDFDENGK